MSNISLTASMRSNLLSLQRTNRMFDTTQERLATGKKVNSALDNPDNFFTAAALNNRASDLNGLMDSMGQAVQTLKAADQGIQTLTKLVEQAKSLTSTALDASIIKTEVTGSMRIDVYDLDPNKIVDAPNINQHDKITIRSGDANKVESNFGQVFSTSTLLRTFAGATASAGELKMDIYVSGTKYTIDGLNGGAASAGDATIQDLIDNIEATTTLKDKVTVEVVDGKLEITAKDPNDYIVITDTVTNQLNGGNTTTSQVTSTLANRMGLTDENVVFTISIETSEELVNKINAIAAASGPNGDGVDITASIVDGKLKITDNLGNDLSIIDNINYGTVGSDTTGLPPFTSGQSLGITGVDKTGSNLRANYSEQFDGLRIQMNMIVQDTGYKGVNLLKGDDLSVIFNESRTSKLDISGVTFDALGMGITQTENKWKTNTDIEKQLRQVENALAEIRAQATRFGNNLAVVQTREEFSEGLINTLTAGADKLILADMNEEAANMLALQTRQQLGTNSLSLASQSAQSVLKLF